MNLQTEVLVHIEISKNSSVKYEFKNNRLNIDRILHPPMVYPYNYGYIPKTLSGDGDPLDAMVITDNKLQPGSYIKCRPIGMLVTEDESGMDEKIICVPITKIDPTHENIKNINQLPQHILKQIEFFFGNYKCMEKEKWVKINGFKYLKDAISTIENSKIHL
jgi:inorganic pyrophosphatase